MAVNKTYGLGYMGSKSGIAPWIMAHLPSADTFVDLFAGGCAITHAALISGKYKHIICNDITDIPKLFCDAIAGKYRNETRWISREDFNRLKDTDPYVRLVWSFGNNQSAYMYSKDIEPLKKASHYAVFFNDGSLFLQRGIKVSATTLAMPPSNAKYQRLKTEVRRQMGRHDLQSLESLERLQSLESLQRLQSLESLERLQSLESLQSDYQDVILPDNAVVYADPPYRGTAEYLHEFDVQRFDDWVRNSNHPIYVSEYSMPKDFKRIAATNKSVTLRGGSGRHAIESIFLHEKWLK
jgi:site-specific DNA-adenine methylase